MSHGGKVLLGIATILTVLVLVWRGLQPVPGPPESTASAFEDGPTAESAAVAEALEDADDVEARLVARWNSLARYDQRETCWAWDDEKYAAVLDFLDPNRDFDQTDVRAFVEERC